MDTGPYINTSTLQHISIRHKHYAYVKAQAVEVVVSEVVAFRRGEIILSGNGCTPFTAKGEQHTYLRSAQESPRLIIFGVDIIILEVAVEGRADPQTHERHNARGSEREKIL